MSIKKVDAKALDKILETMVSTVSESKDEVFDIGEQCRKDFETLSKELDDVKIRVAIVITDSDALDSKARFARKRLSEVSMHFNHFSEEQVRDAYERAHKLQVDLQINRQLEKELRNRRDELELRLRGLQQTIDKAVHLVSQISVVQNYLTQDLKFVGEALQEAKRKQDFGLKIIEAQEQERKKLSREIHDGPAQMLANVMMRSDLIERVQRERGPDEALVEIRSLKVMVRNALYEVRRIIYDLRPMALDDLGLVPTLRKYLQTTEDYNNGVNLNFVNLGQVKRLPSDMEVALFRLVQEAVQNSLKHADPKQIQVKLSISKEMVTVVVKDDGKGFDSSIQKEGSFGLVGMRERVELLEGEMTIDSQPGAGTLVFIQIPYHLNNRE
ncbi:sensor histidine kinase [Peribacillus frigoritolerans]|jgi:two-component system, NarL family, sensor histidine kinase DegS|uniref:Signal transduction histidine-protein kinase/phosphatase DegS n=1 Tax=Peribacillus frigoritolerans TaxID=450367 RepID=A0AAJ1QT06_9BACI|nr:MULTISPECIES: sensor histidine kinase [Bacillaceae]KOR81040.1 histidine kinase [Bacillus sp. FJAT-21352]KOR85278.1 histidine kinase [Bacillus sp. FJAT-22058]KRF50792.1 histidine kinase [Bacillus sp. Soil745]MBD8138339.1 sensor histidine kinase [Bacillus sp. CFBP 13597]MBL3642458.1 sensor histidine kinase [Bacillus sp. RHFB]MCD1160558.1 sensor histidine kinase [Peribacillus castrilensis]MCP1092735.1 sensor histidine kinase [Bacillaceae bacterium OS4b]MDP9738439.1 two-component system sens